LSTLVAIAVVTGLFAFAGIKTWDAYSLLPGVPSSAPVILILITVVVFATGLSLRIRLRATREGRVDIKPVDPLLAARAVVFAKASSLVGALVAGVYAGYGAFLLRDLEVAPRRDRAILCALSVAAAVLLVLAALFVEWVCRVPPPRDGEEADEPRSVH
jgi:Protein of unknown function (DUF3180)